MFHAAHFLRLVDMAQRNVVGGRESIGGKGFERAHIDLAHRLVAAGAHGGQMAGGDDGQFAAQRGLQLLLQIQGRFIHLLIGGLNGGLQGQLLVLRALTGLALLYVAGADKGQGTDDAAGPI